MKMLQRSLTRCSSVASHASLDAVSTRCIISATPSAASSSSPSSPLLRPSSRRAYSTPTKRAESPAEATVTSPMTSNLPPGFLFPQKPQLMNQLFPLSGAPPPPPLTVLPMPLPDDPFTSRPDPVFGSAIAARSLAIIDACVYNCFDVPRAKRLFEELQQMARNHPADSVINLALINTMLRAYADMALGEDAQVWLPEVAELYESMQDNGFRPDSTTYAIMLSTLERIPHGAKGLRFADVLQDLRSSEPRVSLASIVTHEMFSDALVSQNLTKSLLDAAYVLKDKSMQSELQALLEAKPDDFTTDPREGLPDVLPVTLPSVTLNQEGQELAGELKTDAEQPFNLGILKQSLDKVMQSRREYIHDPATRQRILEESALDAARARLERQAKLMQELDIQTNFRETSIQTYMWEWHEKLKPKLAQAIKKLKDSEKKRKSNTLAGGNMYSATDGETILPFLTLVSPDTLSLITIMELMQHQNSSGIEEGKKLGRTLLDVGKSVEAEYQARLLKRHGIIRPANSHGNLSANTLQSLVERRTKDRELLKNRNDFAPEWTATIRVRVGSFCVDALMEVATVKRTIVKDGVEYTEEQPAFGHSYDYIRGQRVGLITTNVEIKERMAREPVYDLLHPRQLPMLVEPRPWVTPFNGGYLRSRNSAMRFKDSLEQKKYLQLAGDEGKLEQPLQALDVLSSTPWVVNKEVFDVVLKVWNSGEAFGDIPPAATNTPEPEKPEAGFTDLNAKAQHLAAMRQAIQERRNNHSERCSTNYKVAVAHAFLGETFYFPHNFDFRGRAYPIPPHLNHLGDDLCRGMLKFAEGKPLGERGLRWLKIHLANVFGNDKGSFDDRARFTMDHVKDVYDSAERPLEGNRWWLKADDPWQCLATCIELRAALESPDPIAYVSNLPVHQDGTCNGLQHYAALGGDAAGAAQVNLAVTEKPSDVYTFVANMVEDQLAAEAAEGHPVAKLLSGRIARKIVKQTVMTTVYGVTQIGARAQIERQLRDRNDFKHENCFQLAAYLAAKVLGCIGDLFSGANAIQDWLSVSARLIAKSVPMDRVDHTKIVVPGTTKHMAARKAISKEQMTAVIWETPLGLPVVQPYRKISRKQIMTSMQSVYLGDPTKPTGVNSMKQASAFPPNFIHSLDATHMVLTALEMRKQGMAFASVHDSYWTHASDIDRMSGIIRDTFIDLHSRDILGSLRSQFLTRYANHYVPAASMKASERALAVSQGLLSKDEAKQIQKTSKSSAAEKEDAETEVEADSETPSGDLVKSNKVLNDLTTATFIPLERLIPPLPKKGSFDVRTTKKSLYFFS